MSDIVSMDDRPEGDRVPLVRREHRVHILLLVLSILVVVVAICLFSVLVYEERLQSKLMKKLCDRLLENCDA